jgi:Aldehyde dehydrogenase family
MALARQMNTGTVDINNVMAIPFPVPMEGWNESGVGSRSGGADGIRKYCGTKSIVADRVAMKKEPLLYPYSRKKGKIIAAMLRMTSARDWRRRLGR